MKNVKIQTPDSHLVTVYTLNDAVRADLIRNMLRDNNIVAQVSGETQAGFTGALPVEIIVRETDAAAAAKLIRKLFPEG